MRRPATLVHLQLTKLIQCQVHVGILTRYRKRRRASFSFKFTNHENLSPRRQMRSLVQVSASWSDKVGLLFFRYRLAYNLNQQTRILLFVQWFFWQVKSRLDQVNN